MKLDLVSAWDEEEYKGNPESSRFVFADSPEEAYAFWREEYFDADAKAGEFDGLPNYDCIIEVPVSAERGVAYGKVWFDGTAPECPKVFPPVETQ